MTFKQICSPTLKALFEEELERMILSGELKIGEKLPPERELANMMKISRSVVNDGITDMAHKGFLTIIPRKGTYVANFKQEATVDILIALMKHGSLSNDYIRSVLEIRNLFMNYALETAIPKITLQQFDNIKQNCKKFSFAKTPEEGAQCIYELDHSLVICSDNVLLPILFSSFKTPNIMLFQRFFERHGLKKMNERNLLLLQCIERKDIEGAKNIMRHSIDQTIHGTTEIYSNS